MYLPGVFFVCSTLYLMSHWVHPVELPSKRHFKRYVEAAT